MAATYTVKDVAQILGYSTNSIYTFLKEKRIKGVRVGKGRFRIPQEELNRLLETRPQETIKTNVSNHSHPDSQQSTSLNESPSHNETFVLPSSPVFEITRGLEFTDHASNLFDWCIGMASIVLGTAMMFLTQSLEEFGKTSGVLLIPLRVTLVAAGIGLLLMDITGRTKSAWYRLYLWILAAGYGTGAIALLLGRDTGGAVLFFLFCGAIIINATTTLTGGRLLILLAYAINAVLPVVYVWGMSGLGTTWGIPQFILNYRDLVVAVWMVIALGLGLIVWRKSADMEKRTVTLCILIAISTGFLSWWYSSQVYWGRALVLLLVSIMIAFKPVWDTLFVSRVRERRMMIHALGLVLLLYLVTIGFLTLAQYTIISYAKQQLIDKTTYGTSLITSTIRSMKTTLESVSRNSLLISGIDTQDTTVLLGLTRGIFEAQRDFRSVTTMDRDGNVLTIYPLIGSESEKNYANRFDVIQARTSGRTYVSNLLLSELDPTIVPTVYITVPVYKQDDEIVGMVSGMLDLDRLGAVLEELAAGAMGEYFVLLDSDGKKIVGMGGEALRADEELVAMIQKDIEVNKKNQRIIVMGGIRYLQAYDTIENTGWSILIQVPLTSILRVSQTATLTTLFLTLMSFVVIGSQFIIRRVRHSIPEPEEPKPGG